MLSTDSQFFRGTAICIAAYRPDELRQIEMDIAGRFSPRRPVEQQLPSRSHQVCGHMLNARDRVLPAELAMPRWRI
jgi:hypothetical protein